MSTRDERLAEYCRRLLYMVRELHAMGYEQLRIAPNVAPSGLFWRLSICAASNTLPEHGAAMRDFHEGAHYSSGGMDRYFDWDDAADDSPSELALKFVERFPELAKAGKGDDPAYVRWYEDMLRVTEPDGLPYPLSDVPSPDDRLGIFYGSMDIEIPLPPPFRKTDD
jgi:ADP-ribosyl-[dinitrogen reductase] hydrolase